VKYDVPLRLTLTSVVHFVFIAILSVERIVMKARIEAMIDAINEEKLDGIGRRI